MSNRKKIKTYDGKVKFNYRVEDGKESTCMCETEVIEGLEKANRLVDTHRIKRSYNFKNSSAIEFHVQHRNYYLILFGTIKTEDSKIISGKIKEKKKGELSISHYNFSYNEENYSPHTNERILTRLIEVMGFFIYAYIMDSQNENELTISWQFISNLKRKKNTKANKEFAKIVKYPEIMLSDALIAVIEACANHDVYFIGLFKHECLKECDMHELEYRIKIAGDDEDTK